jgi:glyoxylase-like metal-dependent hydrolase (beta-lactamase superfamily II)
LNPAAWKYGVRWIDGPLQQHAHQTFTVKDNLAWHTDGPAAGPVASTPDLAEIYQLDMWLNPHGFLKAARLPGANPKATWRWELGEMGRDGPEVRPERVTVVSITVNGKYRVDATINQQNMLQRIHTWVANPVLGDMNYEHEFTNDSYVDLGSGIKFPTGWHSHQGWDDNYGTQNVSAGHNAFGGTLRDVRANQCADPPSVPAAVQRATFAIRVEPQKLADGVYLMGGGSHNSVAVEFKDWIAVFEAPLDEDRSLAVIDAIVRLIPGKPIRWVINSHQHFDHVGGLRTYMHIGATIITHWKNYDFYNRDVLTYAQRTLKPDMVSMWPPTELAEGYYYETIRENFVISDGTRNLNVHYVNPLQHVEGMLIAYLPKEKLLLEADLLDTDQPRPASPTRDQISFHAAVTRLGLDVAQIVPVHGKPVPWSDFAAGIVKARPSGQ